MNDFLLTLASISGLTASFWPERFASIPHTEPQMHIQFAAFGHSIEIDSRLPHALYIFTRSHEFAWSRDEWFHWPDDKPRHWVIERKEPRTGKVLSGAPQA